MKEFNVSLKKIVDDSYDISIGYDLKNELIDDLKGGLLGKVKKLALITDSVVDGLYADNIMAGLKEAGFSPSKFVFEAGEKSKTRKVKAMIEDEMLEADFRRDCAVVALGGGVVSDLAGFIAGTFARGVPFIIYSTTLLSAADASIGGKTAVDTKRATNLIGLFNQPKKVYIDIETWNSLPKRQISNGLAETIKHACMADEKLFSYLEDNMDAILNLKKEECEHIAERNCDIKYRVVMKDEKESGLREILNLGHTVGRAIETLSDYRLLHGEAVAIGLVAQAMLSNSLGYMTEDEVLRVKKLIKLAKLPTSIPEYIDREELVNKLYTDKKVRDGKLRFVLEKGIGNIVSFGGESYATEISKEQARDIILRMD